MERREGGRANGRGWETQLKKRAQGNSVGKTEYEEKGQTINGIENVKLIEGSWKRGKEKERNNRSTEFKKKM